MKKIPPTLLLALSALFSRGLGVVRDHLLARTFGATSGAGIYNLDTYYAAFRIPDLIYNLLIVGTLSSVLIPMIAQYRKDNKLTEAWEFSSSMMHLTLLVVAVLSGLTYLGAPWLAHAVAGGFSPEQLALTTRLMRIMVLSPLFFTLAAVPIALQDSFKNFFWRSAGPLFYNLGIIGGIVYFGQTFGVIGVTWGVVAGSVLQFLVQLPALARIGYRHHWILGLGRADVRKAVKIMVPRIIGPSLPQITLVINTLIASFFATGSITIFYLADNLQGLPMGIIAVSFAITSFATLSELAAEPTAHAFAAEIRRVMHQVLLLIIPATVGMILLRHEIIDLILRNGKFTDGDAALTATVLIALLISLFAQALLGILARGFYAHHNTRTPLTTGLIGTFVSVAGSLVLGFYFHLEILGVALAWSLGTILNFLLLFTALSRKVKSFLLDLKTVGKIALATLVMAFAVNVCQQYLPYGGAILSKISILGFTALLGAGAYFLMAYLLKLRLA